MPSQVTDNAQAIITVLTAFLTVIGSLSFLQATGIVVGIACTIAVALSTLRVNRAKRIYFEKQNKEVSKAHTID